jgi:hypothetical protein
MSTIPTAAIPHTLMSLLVALPATRAGRALGALRGPGPILGRPADEGYATFFAAPRYGAGGAGTVVDGEEMFHPPRPSYTCPRRCR